MTKIKLIEGVVSDWKEKSLSPECAMFIISTIFSIRNPTEDAINWVKKVFEDKKG